MKSVQGFTVQNLNYLETSNGVAYSAHIMFDGKRVGIIENDGRGGATFIRLSDSKLMTYPQLNEKIREYFNTIGWNTENVDTHSLQCTFADHLLDHFEEGKLSEEMKALGFVS